MSKKYITAIILFLLATFSACYFLFFNKTKQTDAVKFSKEYTQISEDNVFVYRTIDEIISILENGTGIVYLGFPECPWCQKYVTILNEVAKENGIEKIYYYDILEDRKNNTEKYQKIVEILGNNLLYDEEGNHRIYVPDITFVLNGEIVGHDNETSVVTEEEGTPEEYWTTEKISSLKAKLSAYMQTVGTQTCVNGCNE